MTSASEVVEAPRGSVPFSLESIIVELEGGRYISPIIPASMADLVSGRRPAGRGAPKGRGGGGGSGGGSRKKEPSPKMVATGGSARVKARYDAHLPSLSLQDGENSRSILAGEVLPTLHGHVLCKNCYLCGMFWE